MNQESYKRDTCRFCLSKKLTMVLPVSATPPGDIYVSKDQKDKPQTTHALDMYMCDECGLVQLLTVIDPSILYGNYIYETSVSLGLVDHFKAYVDKIIEIVKPVENSLVIETGSNDGTVLRFFQAHKMRTLGIDPAESIAKKATASGVETIATFFNFKVSEDVKKKYGSASIVVANNVFANIDDLQDFVLGIKNLLAPDGVFVFETGYSLATTENNLFDNIYHEHLTYFSVKSLEYNFRKLGMQLFHAEDIPTKGGSIRCMAKLASSKREILPSVAKMLEKENRLKADKPESWKPLENKLNSIKVDLLTLLKKKKSEGKKICGYGASVGVTTMLYHFELSEYVECLFDDNPVRDGLFSPGYHIPVVSSDKIYSMKPDYILVLAWRYIEPIMKRHKKFMDDGGKFIRMFPEKVEILP